MTFNKVKIRDEANPRVCPFCGRVGYPDVEIYDTEAYEDGSYHYDVVDVKCNNCEAEYCVTSEFKYVTTFISDIYRRPEYKRNELCHHVK